MVSILRTTTSRVPGVLPRRSSKLLVNNYATELQRPPPPPTHEPAVQLFSETSQPRPYYAKHPPFRDLPKPAKTWPVLLVVGAVGITGWVGFMNYVTNQEMLSSSVFRSIMRSVREDEQLQQHLGQAIRPQPEWWLNGDPRIQGKINQLQGNIDVSFRIRGSKGSGTLYFTSIRKEKGVPFTILRFKVICDDGAVVHVESSPV
ncbi:cytochrome oxidase complex assembly protein 1-domain-containing protein [Crucibulum laeve]|uniref:Cytochrome oxidase complex assembly protein 1-domain-containing protein n=1 Tax=Crucibulum laeve TaxID=68775 RepID=A0A5C3LVN9_9AGAR|nr:cytochrome oxidase complex assembly protein 1-domain-containing protein [Crucibulum laeve]